MPAFSWACCSAPRSMARCELYGASCSRVSSRVVGVGTCEHIELNAHVHTFIIASYSVQYTTCTQYIYSLKCTLSQWCQQWQCDRGAVRQLSRVGAHGSWPLDAVGRGDSEGRPRAAGACHFFLATSFVSS